MKQVFHHLDDPSHPVWHATDNPDKVRAHIIALQHEWLAGQPESIHYLFCEHGSYVGYNRALAYDCPLCPEQ